MAIVYGTSIGSVTASSLRTAVHPKLWRTYNSGQRDTIIGFNEAQSLSYKPSTTERANLRGDNGVPAQNAMYTTLINYFGAVPDLIIQGFCLWYHEPDNDGVTGYPADYITETSLVLAHVMPAVNAGRVTPLGYITCLTGQRFLDNSWSTWIAPGITLIGCDSYVNNNQILKCAQKCLAGGYDWCVPEFGYSSTDTPPDQATYLAHIQAAFAIWNGQPNPPKHVQIYNQNQSIYFPTLAPAAPANSGPSDTIIAYWLNLDTSSPSGPVVGTYSNIGSSAAVGFTLPSGLVVGQTTVCQINYSGNASIVITPPDAFWVPLGPRQNNGNTVSSQLFQRTVRAGDSGATVAFGLSGTMRWAVAGAVVSGLVVQSGAPVQAQDLVAVTNPTMPAWTPLKDNALALTFMAARDATAANADTFTAPAGWTEDVDRFTATANPNVGAYLMHKLLGAGTAGVAQGTVHVTNAGGFAVTANEAVVVLISPGGGPTNATDTIPLADAITRGNVVQSRSTSDSIPLADVVTRQTTAYARATGGPGLIYNGDFENGGIAGWSAGGALPQPALSPDGTQPDTGTRCMKVSFSAAPGTFAGAYYNLATPRVGEPVTVSARVLLSNAGLLTGVAWAASGLGFGPIGNVVGAYQTITQTFTPTSSSTLVAVEFAGTGAGDAFVDNVMVQYGSGDAIPIADAITRGSQLLARGTADTVPVADVGSAVGARARAIADSIPLAEAVTRGAQTFARLLADLLPLADVVTAVGNLAGQVGAPASSVPTFGNNATPTIVLPTLAGGEVIFLDLSFSTSNSPTVTAVPSTVNGVFTLIGSVTKGLLQLNTYARVAVAADSGATVTASFSPINAKWAVSADAYPGASHTLGAHVYASAVEGAVATQNHTTPTASIIRPGSWVREVVADRGSPGSTSYTPPVTQIPRSQNAGSTGGGAVCVNTGDNGTGVVAGSYGGDVWVGQLSTTTAVMVTIGVAPASAGGGNATATDSIPLADTVARAQGTAARTTADTVPLVETVTRGATAAVRALSAVLPGLSDVLTRAQARSRALADAIPVVDQVTRGAQLRARATADTVPVADAITRTQAGQARGTGMTVIPNGDFGNGGIFGWSAYGTGTAIAYDPTDGRTTAGCLKITASSPGFGSGASYARTNVRVAPGTPVDYGVWMKGDFGLVLGCLLQFYDAGGSIVSTIVPATITADGSWKLYEATGVVPAGAATALLICRQSGTTSGVFRVDDVLSPIGAEDGFGIADAVTKTTGHAVGTADSIPLADVATAKSNRVSILTDSIPLADVVTRVTASGIRAIADALPIAELLNRFGVTAARVSFDDLTITDFAQGPVVSVPPPLRIRGLTGAWSARVPTGSRWTTHT